MSYVNHLILLLMLSALATSAQATHGSAFDGYVDQAQSQPSAVSYSELESDTPDECILAATTVSQPIRSDECFSATSLTLRANPYQDFQARAPPTP